MAQFGSQDMTAVTKHLLLNINPLFPKKRSNQENRSVSTSTQQELSDKSASGGSSFSLLYTTNSIKQQQTRQEIFSFFLFRITSAKF